MLKENRLKPHQPGDEVFVCFTSIVNENMNVKHSGDKAQKLVLCRVDSYILNQNMIVTYDKKTYEKGLTYNLTVIERGSGILGVSLTCDAGHVYSSRGEFVRSVVGSITDLWLDELIANQSN